MASSILFHNGPILTMDPRYPKPEAMLIRGAAIEAVGRYADLLTAPGPRPRIVDLAGRCLLPGFHDPHIHIWKVGHFLTGMLDLRGVNSFEELKDRLRDFAKNFKGGWVIGRGFNEIDMIETRLPDRADLDAVISDRPAYLIRTCAHIAVVNSKALQLAGIDRHTPDPPGGWIGRDSMGKPDGRLAETALGLFKQHLPHPSAKDYRQMILAAGEALLSLGITSATDPAVMPDQLEAYRKLDESGALPLRIGAMAIRLPDGGNTSLPLPDKYAGRRLSVEAVKFFADGGLSGQTAALNHPYRHSKKRGVLRLERQQFLALAREAHQKGYRIGTHAIGDAAIDLVIDVYEQLYREEPSPIRHRIEHLGLPSPEHLQRMAAGGLIAVPQSIFLRELGKNFRAYLPDDYLGRCYPLRSILREGISMALSSDAPVVRNFNPLAGMETAISRRDLTGTPIAPAEAITIEDALKAYTLGGAEAIGTAQQTGSLTPGKQADLIVLDKNPLITRSDQLEKIKVMEVFLDGQMVKNGPQ